MINKNIEHIYRMDGLVPHVYKKRTMFPNEVHEPIEIGGFSIGENYPSFSIYCTKGRKIYTYIGSDFEVYYK